MKDIKYIIKRIVIGVGIFIAIYLLKTEVFAYDTIRYNDLPFDSSLNIATGTDITVSGNFVNADKIAYIFNQSTSYNNLSLDINNYRYILARRTPASNLDYYDYYFSSSPITIDNNNMIGTGSYVHIHLRTRNSFYDSSLTHYMDYATDGFTNTWGVNNTGTSTNHQYFSTFNFTSNNYYTFAGLLDMDDYFHTNKITLDIFDNSYNSISSVGCYNTSISCSITPTQNTRYLRVSYNVPEFLGQRLDILNNQIMQSNTKLKSSNPYVSAKQVYLEYYFNDSTSNVSNNMYFVNSSHSYSVSNQLYNFISSFKQNDDYSSVSLYRFDIYYDLGGVYYNTDLSVPYYLSFKTISSGGSSSETQEEQQQQQIDQNQVIIDNLDDINNSINNSNVDGAKSDYGNFFIEFNSPDHGNLSTIITAPLRAINTITTNTCRDLVIPIPNTGKNLTLPCLKPIYQEKVPTLLGLWNLIILGLVSYRVLTSLFLHIKDLHDPTQDKVEVLDL